MKKHLFFLLLLSLVSIVPGQAQAGLFDSANDEDMPPRQDDAFQFSVDVTNPTTLSAQFVIAPGNYIYRDKIKFEIKADTPIQILPYQLPTSKNKDDEIFGPTEVYVHDINILLPLNRNQIAQTATFTAYYQGCSETFNICYPPTKKSFELILPSYLATTDNSTSTRIEPPFLGASLSEQDQLAQSLAQDSLFKVLLSFFGIGILLAFTPCVFPMIPILSSIIVGEGDGITTRRAFTLSLVYVLAMSVTYTIAGLITGLLGANIQTMLQNTWVIASFSALFVILSLSMFGLYELQLPQGLQNRLHQVSHQQKGGKLAGVALMGLLSGLIVGPCLAPPLAGALIFIGQQGDPILGASALFALSMGMGLPLLAIGTSAGSLLPKAGAWMDGIKAIFGVLMLGLAIWLLERIIPGWIALLLWGGLLIVSAVYLGALNTLGLSSTGWEKFSKGFGLIILIFGTLLLIGSASGSHNVWQPLKGIASVSGTTGQAINSIKFKEINNLSELEQELTQSTQPVMLDFYADWCVECKTMEATTFQDPAVVATLANTTALKLDMTDNNDEHKAFLKQFTIFGPPTILFFDPQGNEYKQHRLVGTMNARDFNEHLSTIPAIGK
ncbi:MAG: thiol:disulfide interchange protein DsbD [Methylophagaceae bacterium]|jgi:thiol:disulfide interchange protein DsbD